MSFIGSAAQPESAYRHWFGRNVAAHRHSFDEPPLSTAELKVVRGDPNHLVDAWLVGDDDASGVVVAETAGCTCAETDWFRLSCWHVGSSSWRCSATVASSGIRWSASRSNRTEPGRLSQTFSLSCALATTASST
ncbi:hypothetical protein [Calidifontibacter indicus]|uniref:hypothetical protein n=1 Tax=Calidifontibacter indicus TaxID=419650 RepID=UPI000E255BB5|nr:hypothetical protein [Calidifontibacter indicus]